MTLSDGKIRGEYTLQKMDLPLPVYMRLQALGMTTGTEIYIRNKKKQGAVIFTVRGTRLAVGQEIADRIFIEENGGKQNG